MQGMDSARRRCKITRTMESRFPIRPQPRLEEVLSGLATIMIIAVGYGTKHPDIADSFWSSEKPLAFVAGLGLSLFIVSWIAGTILDTGRDLFEWVIDWFWPLNWDFLMTAPTGDVQRLNGEYFAYYLLNANYVIGGLVILGLAKLSIITLQPWALGIIAIITAILFLEAAFLRKEIRAIEAEE